MERRFNVFLRCLQASMALGGLLMLGACGRVDPLGDAIPLDDSKLQDGIISGKLSKPSDYPATGAIIFITHDRDGSMTGSMLCSGTLIAPDVVLTAAHCNLGALGMSTKKVTYYFSLSLNVADFGRNGVVLPPQTAPIATVVPHPSFRINRVPPGLGHSNDIGLMYLQYPIYSVEPAPLIGADEVGVLKPGQPVAIAGYGRRHNFERENDAGIKYHGTTFLNRVGRFEMQVSRGDPDPHKCHGDSGGPTFMFFNPNRNRPARVVLVGVTSHAFDNADCLNGGVDTRVDRYLNWISSDMHRACRDGRRPACPRSR